MRGLTLVFYDQVSFWDEKGMEVVRINNNAVTLTRKKNMSWRGHKQYPFERMDKTYEWLCYLRKHYWHNNESWSLRFCWNGF